MTIRRKWIKKRKNVQGREISSRIGMTWRRREEYEFGQTGKGCEMRTEYKKEMAEHERNGQGIMSGQCDERFKHHGGLREHLKIEHEERCGWCKKKYICIKRLMVLIGKEHGI